MAPKRTYLGSLSLTWPHMSACWVSPPYCGWMLLSLWGDKISESLCGPSSAASRNTSHLTHNSALCWGPGRWAGADTFLLTITSHTGPTFRLSGPLGFFSIHFQKSLRPMGPIPPAVAPRRARVCRGQSH